MLSLKRWGMLVLSLLVVFVLVLTACGPQPAAETPTEEPTEATEAPKEEVTEAPTEEVTEAPTEEATESPKEGPVGEKILVHARASDSATMDPAEMVSAADWPPAGEVFDTLVEYDQDMEIIPHLAKSWEVSDDGTEWTFHLRDDVKFHDGTPFNADAVVFTFERARDESHPAHEFGTWDNWSWYLYMVTKVEAVDDYTVKFTLEYPFATFLDVMTNTATGIVSPTAYMEKKDKFRVEPVGTGAFKFVEWMKDDRIVLEKNPDYFMGEPKLDKVIYRVIPENTAQLSALKTGEVQVVAGVSPEIAQLIEQEESLTLIARPGLDISFIRWNMNPDLEGYQEPFGDRRVREALARSIDREAMLERFFTGYGELAENPIPSAVWGRDESLKMPEYDPEKAKELLAEAGYADGFETTLRFWPIPFASLPQPAKMAEAIQSYLKDVNVDAEVVVEEVGLHWDTVSAGKGQLYITGWIGDFADPDNFLPSMWEDEASGSLFGWKNPEFNRLLTEARQETDREKRGELYFQAQKIFYDELPGLTLFTGMNIIAHDDSVIGLQMRPDGAVRYWNVDMKVE